MERIKVYGNNRIKFGKLTFSEKELKDLLKAWLAISVAFAIVLTGFNSGLFIGFIVASLTVGVGFIFHELAHKFLAQKYGAWAEFRSFDQMLVLAVLMSFLGFVFAAPGAVMIQGRTIGKRRNGLISAAGPAMNFVLALLFLPILLNFSSGILGLIGRYGFMINVWLGLFNMIPFAMFDGKKIFEWNKVVYGVLVVVAVVLMVLQTII